MQKGFAEVERGELKEDSTLLNREWGCSWVSTSPRATQGPGGPLAAKGEQPRARGVCGQQQHEGCEVLPVPHEEPEGERGLVQHPMSLGTGTSLHRGPRAVLCHLPSRPENRLRGFAYYHSSSWLAWKHLAFLSSPLIAYFLMSESLHDGCSWVKQRLPGLLLL